MVVKIVLLIGCFDCCWCLRVGITWWVFRWVSISINGFGFCSYWLLCVVVVVCGVGFCFCFAYLFVCWFTMMLFWFVWYFGFFLL